MKGNLRSLISLCVNYKRLGKYLIDEWSRFILNTHCKNHMCKNAQKSNQNCLNPFRTTNNLKSKSLRRQQNSNPLISLWQSVMIRYARQVKFIWMPTIWSDASDLQSQASFRGRWQAWYLGRFATSYHHQTTRTLISMYLSTDTDSCCETIRQDW